jgi:hypothetical protein
LVLPLGDQRELSRHPRTPGFSDTLEFDPVGRRWEPFRQLQVRGVTYWVTLRKSLLENDSPLGVVLSVMAAVLVDLLLSLAGLNRWLSGRLWQPFHQTLAALRGYELQRISRTNLLSSPHLKPFLYFKHYTATRTNKLACLSKY